MLEQGTEVEVKLPGRFKVSPQIAGAIKAVPGVVQVEAFFPKGQVFFFIIIFPFRGKREKFSNKPKRASPPGAPPETITPALIEAAKKEGQVVWYTSADLHLAQLVGKAFEQKFPGVAVRVERGGAERIYTRVGQEYASGIHAVDTVNTGDAAQFLDWKRQKFFAPYVPEDVAKHIAPAHRDPDGVYATVRSTLCVIAYNTELVKRTRRRKVSPTCSTRNGKAKSSRRIRATAVPSSPRPTRWCANSAGPIWKSCRSKMCCRSSRPPTRRRKSLLGERAVMADGNEYNVLLAQGGRQADRAGLCQLKARPSS